MYFDLISNKSDFINLFTINYWTFLKYLLRYIVIGVFWSFFKWFRLVKRKVFLYKNAVKKSEEKITITGYKSPVSIEDYMPDYYDKVKIPFWIGYWPFSLLRFFFGEFLNNFFKNIAKLFSSFYDKITTKALEIENYILERIKELKKQREELIQNKDKTYKMGGKEFLETPTDIYWQRFYSLGRCIDEFYMALTAYNNPTHRFNKTEEKLK